jgi:paired amphipathic helix protein Sin3a
MFDVKNEEKLNIRIAVNNYRAFFQIGTQEGFHALPAERANNVEAAEQALAHHDEFIKEKYVLAASAVKGLSEADLASGNATFDALIQNQSEKAEGAGVQSGEMDVDS